MMLSKARDGGQWGPNFAAAIAREAAEGRTASTMRR